MRQHRLSAGTALAITLVSLVAACGTSSGSSSKSPGGSSASKGTVSIGEIEPFSGSFGFYGKNLSNSMNVEISKINNEGGLLGYQVKLVTRDDQLATQDAVSAAKELSSDSSMKMIEGPSFTSFYLASKGIYEKNKALNCQVAVDQTSAIQGAQYTFRSGVYNTVNDEALLAYLKDHTSVRTLGLVYSHDATGESIDSDLQTLAPKYGIKYLGVQYFNEGATTMTAQVSKLKDADALYLSGNSGDAGLTAASARQIGYKGQLVGNSGLQGFTYIESSKGAADGTIFSSQNLDAYTQKPTSEWPAAYRQEVEATIARYGVTTGATSGVKEFNGSTLSGDCVVEWAAAVRKAGTFDSAKVAAAWQTLSLPAETVPTGVAVHFTPTNHNEFQSGSQLPVYKFTHVGNQWLTTQLTK